MGQQSFPLFLGGIKLSLDNPYMKYKKTQIETADQGKLIMMLYDGAIKFVNKAIELMSHKKRNIEEIHKNIMKAQDIIVELMSSLNMEIEFSQKLLSIYMYINKRLVDANMKKTDEPLIEVKQYLVELRDAWEKAAKQVDSNNLDPSQNNGGVNIAT